MGPTASMAFRRNTMSRVCSVAEKDFRIWKLCVIWECLATPKWQSDSTELLKLLMKIRGTKTSVGRYILCVCIIQRHFVTLFSAADRWMKEYGALVKWCWQRKLKYSEKRLYECQSLHHKYHMDGPGIESLPVPWFKCYGIFKLLSKYNKIKNPVES